MSFSVGKQRKEKLSNGVRTGKKIFQTAGRKDVTKTDMDGRGKSVSD